MGCQPSIFNVYTIQIQCILFDEKKTARQKRQNKATRAKKRQHAKHPNKNTEGVRERKTILKRERTQKRETRERKGARACALLC